MEKFELQAKARSEVAPKKLRAEGLIPAIVYGNKIATENLAIAYPEFEKLFRKAGESSIVSLVVDGKPRNVLIQDVQRHYLTGRYQHIDFYTVSMTEKLTATVPLEFVGESKAVRENGGVMLELLKEVEVQCLPADLPHAIPVDISALKTFEDAIYIKDLKVDSKVELTADPETIVVKVDPPRDVEAELAQDQVGDVSQVEGVADAPKEGEEGAEAVEDKKE
jgi:large subunit ribosomal protein L25